VLQSAGVTVYGKVVGQIGEALESLFFGGLLV
jgi:hypothetical protein